MDDQDKLIESLSQAITKALRDLSLGIKRSAAASSIELPSGSGPTDATGQQTSAPPLEPSQATPPTTITSDFKSEFTTIEPPTIALRQPDTTDVAALQLPTSNEQIPTSVTPQLEPPTAIPPAIVASNFTSEFTTIEPPTIDSHQPDPLDVASVKLPALYEQRQESVTPPLTLPLVPPRTETQTQPPLESSTGPVFLPLAEPKVSAPGPAIPLDGYSSLDIKRGFSADDPTGRKALHHEQTAQAMRYDSTTDALYDSQVKQSRIDRDYRQRVADLFARMLKDYNNSYRRIDDLERRNECSVENITDCNI